MILYLDYETHSTIPIRRGTDRYLDGATPLLLTYAFDDGPIQVCDFTKKGWPVNFFFDNMGRADSTKTAHNAFFDRMVTEKLLGIQTDVFQWHCTMAQALSHGLPGALGPLCTVLDVPQDLAKIEDGQRLIRKFCCGPEILKDDPEWGLFIQYAKNDISAARECHKRMPNWNYKNEELRLWHIDQIINNRGFAVDTQLAEQAIKSLKKEKDKLDEEIWIQTCGSITAATQRDKLLVYLCEQQGCVLRDLRATTIQEAIDDESLDEAIKSLLRIRLAAAKTSTSKFNTMLRSTGKDGRLRGTLQYAGAARTSRWAGRIFQPQNLPRPTMKLSDIRCVTEAIRSGKPDVATLFAPIGQACMNVLRGLIVAEEGSTLMVSDYSAIEGRANAWLAGEDWKTAAFKRGERIYCRVYEQAFGLPHGAITQKANPLEDQMGKVMELALGFGGGVGAFLNMAAVYNLDLEELGRVVVPEEKSLQMWEKALKDGTDFGLSKAVYCACDTLKLRYRKANPAITQSWYLYEDAARKVIEQKNPALKISVGDIVFDCDPNWMRIKLPSGRFLCYARPKIGGRKRRVEEEEEEFNGKGEISYMSWRNKQWSRTKTYGGKLCIAEGTPVLTDIGWVPIESYVPSMKLWDGVQWVYGGRLVDNGYAPVLTYSGVRMTEDHDVLTVDGWRSAFVAQSQRLKRQEVCFPDNSPLYTEQGWKDLLACPVRMRKQAGGSRQRANQEGPTAISEKLRVPNESTNRLWESDSRNGTPSGVSCLAKYEESVRAINPSRMEELRKAGDHRLQGMDRIFRSLLEGYGRAVQTWRYLGAQREFEGLQQSELRVENQTATSKQSAQQCSDSDQVGTVNGSASVPQSKAKRQYSARAVEARLARRPVAKVYDIENVGPLHRFVVQGSGGQNVIVHNCENIVQAVARDLLGYALLGMHEKNFPVVLHIHDEIIAEVPQTSGLTFDQFNMIMQTRPKWAPGFPLEAKGYEGTRYEKR